MKYEGIMVLLILAYWGGDKNTAILQTEFLHIQLLFIISMKKWCYSFFKLPDGPIYDLPAFIQNNGLD